jgi:hypothetical protein
MDGTSRYPTPRVSREPGTSGKGRRAADIEVLRQLSRVVEGCRDYGQKAPDDALARELGAMGLL